MPCSTKQSTRTQSTHRYPIRDSPGPLQKQDRLCKKGWLKILPPKGGHRGLAFLGASSLLEASWPSTVEWQQPKDCRITEQAESLLRKVLATRSYSSFVPFRVALRLFVPTSPQSFCRTIGTIVDVKRSIPVWPSPGPFFRNRRVCGYWGKKKKKKYMWQNTCGMNPTNVAKRTRTACTVDGTLTWPPPLPMLATLGSRHLILISCYSRVELYS